MHPASKLASPATVIARVQRPGQVARAAAGVLLLLPLVAVAQMAPYAVGVTQSVSREDNLFKSVAGSEVGDWVSSTSLIGEYVQQIGRQKVFAAATVSVLRYRNNDQLNANVYRLESKVDWSTVGLLTGTAGGDVSLKPYEYGQAGELPIDNRNLERNEHLFLTAKLGGITELTFLGGLDLLNRSYSNPLFDSAELRQLAVDLGAQYQPNPDLTMGAKLRRTEGRQPKLLPVGDRSRRVDVQLFSRWQVTGASGLDANLGFTQDDHTVLSDRSFWNGSVQWTWRPTGRLTLVSGLRRDASDSFTAPQGDASRVLGTSLRNTVDLSATWQVSSKVQWTGLIQHGVRDFSSASLLGSGSGKDTYRTLRTGLSYELTRNLLLGCEYVGEQRRVSDADGLVADSRPYDASKFSCNAEFWLR